MVLLLADWVTRKQNTKVEEEERVRQYLKDY